MSDKKKVSVAIPSWNGLEHLKICIEALAAQNNPGMDWEIIVFDNGSRDGTAQWLERQHPGIKVISSGVNIGFAGAVNRLVADAEGEVVAILNNDTRPEPEWLGVLVDALYSAPSDVAVVSGLIVDWSGERLDFAKGCMTFDGHAFQLDFHKRLKDCSIPAPGTDLLFACGGNMIVRKNDFVESGGFDEDYFAYYEDVDFGWRLWGRGRRIICAPDARVAHRSGATSDALGNYCRGSLFERNSFLTAYKNYDQELWEKMMPAVLLALLSRTQHLLTDSNPGADVLTENPFSGSLDNFTGQSGFFSEGIISRSGQHLGNLCNRVLARLFGGRRPCCKIVNEGTVAQLQAVSYILENIDGAAVKRKSVQAGKVRSDKEIFERFPLYIVPTYRGDSKLFSSAGFNSWLPEELHFVRCELEDIMRINR